MSPSPSCTGCGSPMLAQTDAPVAGLQSFKCPHCHRVQKAAAAAEGHLSPSLVERGQP